MKLQPTIPGSNFIVRQFERSELLPTILGCKSGAEAPFNSPSTNCRSIINIYSLSASRQTGQAERKNMKSKYLILCAVSWLVILLNTGSEGLPLSAGLTAVLPRISAGLPAGLPEGKASASNEYRVSKKSFQPELTLRGIIVPDKIQPVRIEMKEFKSPLKVKNIVPSGAAVAASSVVLELDAEQLAKTISEAVNRFENMKFNIEQTKQRMALDRNNSRKELEKAQIRYERIKEQLKNYKETEWPLQKERDDLSLKHSESRLADQVVELQQLEEMYKESEIAGKTKEIVLERARRDVQLARTSLGLSQREIDYRRNVEHPKKLEDLANEEKWSKDDFESQQSRAAMSLAEAEKSLVNQEIEFKKHTEYLDNLKADLQLCVLTSPMEGIMAYGDLEQRLISGRAPAVQSTEEIQKGDSIQQNQTVAAIYSNRKYGVNVSIPENFRFLVKNNNNAKVFVNALSDKAFNAAISKIAGLADGKENNGLTYSARFTLEDNDGHLQPGLNCTVKFEIDAVPDVIVIPSKFLITRNGKSFVNIRENNAVSEKEVMTGLSKGDEIWITYGLKEGDTLASPK
ncbi:MAG: HlyD family efflux transporter periplasmic adaptor subunit [Planctomycetota bacterium]